MENRDNSEVVVSEGETTRSVSVTQEGQNILSGDKECNIWESFDRQVQSLQVNPTPQANLTAAFEHYKDMPYEPRTSNPLLFWKKNELLFPELKNLSLKYLCVPATSVPSERIFSKTGMITKDRRNRIKDKNLDSIIFLNKNFDLF